MNQTKLGGDDARAALEAALKKYWPEAKVTDRDIAFIRAAFAFAYERAAKLCELGEDEFGSDFAHAASIRELAKESI